ncbi:MAG: LTA synthase family protein [Clostridiaceae bacterium]|nr:LTA synthase family protein [Clostridiaceae bacterium]
MLQKYFQFTKKRVAIFLLISALIILLQIVLTGSLVSRQTMTTEAGNSQSAVIGILDQTELVRQKFKFNRKVVLEEFTLSFGSFERDEVGDNLNIQMTDADNNIVYTTTIPVDDISPNAAYRVAMDYTVTIPKGVTCCIKLSCSSDDRQYDTIPTLNTTNRTDPNTFMSTMKMQTRKKCLNISYTYSYRQIFPLIMIILEFAFLFVLCFEKVTQIGVVLRRKKRKEDRRKEKAKELEIAAVEKRERKKSRDAKILYTKNHMEKQPAKHKKKNKMAQKKEHSFKNLVKWCLTEPKFINWVRRIAFIINPLLILFSIELMNQTLTTMVATVWLFAWMLLLAIQLLVFAVFGSETISMLLLNAVMFPAGVANLILMNVRGTPFLPSDLLALATATEVAQTYEISLTPAQFVMLPWVIIWCFFLLRIRKKRQKRKIWRIAVRRLAPLAVSCSVIFLLYNTPVLENSGITDNVWNKVASSRSNGFYLNFFINLHYLSVSEPDGYSQDTVASILNDMEEAGTDTDSTKNRVDETGAAITGNSDFDTNTSLNGEQPNIILIMNESLADYDLIGETNYNRDPLEYLHSMRENTIYGKDYVSIYGAGTSNSEFEAMTGNTMTFFPSGCNVYQQFMHESTFSMPSYLKSLGYATAAIHPSSGENWNRINAYNSMRFDRFVTIEEFENPEYVRYISDKESYKKVIQLYEEKEEGQPIFLFDMTIQNHGGYLTNTNWKNPVYVKGAYYQEAKEFLSATKVSDDAFRYLVEYFKEQDEPTIICMFGDHQPSIETEFYEELLGKDEQDWDLEDIQKRYVTPFVIWANYDISESQNAVLSNNYLENLILKQAGLELPKYNQFIEKVSGEIPVLNVNGYLDNDGNWHKYDTDETDTISQLLNQYELLQYGYYSDNDKETMAELFGISEW